MNNRSAAGLRRSAIVARIRLREEWSELKGPEAVTQKKLNQIPEIIRKQQKPVRSASKVVTQKIKFTSINTQPKSPIAVLSDRTNAKSHKSKSTVTSQGSNMNGNLDVLRGVVALVEVGTESRGLALRAALAALGATLLPTWSPLVTHLIWTEGGCRATRAKARALACRVVSPLWVEACAASGRRAPEPAFPAAARPSDLPSPHTLRIMLKRAQAENVPLSRLLNGNKEPCKSQEPRLRISSDTDHDTSADRTTDTSRDLSTDQTNSSHDRSRDTTDPEARVNTLPRGGRASPPRRSKSRRKLFTQKEDEGLTSGDEKETPAASKRVASVKLTQRERRDLARAERMARRLLAAPAPASQRILARSTEAPAIVLTGMSRTERQVVQTAIKTLNGRVQKQVNHRTTHVLLGSCRSSGNQIHPDYTGILPLDDTTQCTNIPSTNTRILSKNTTVTGTQIPKCEIPKARTLNALLGAAKGCRVLYAQWVMDSLEVKKWLHHHGYEVAHLKKISQKARVERAALGRTCSEYGYDVFSGMRVRIQRQAEQRDAVIKLLALCGGVLQDGGHETADFDVCIGIGDGEISSKWVFDSVAAGRMRTTRRYINSSVTENR